MDLGIAGRRAIVCASSWGLGKACARALARAGVAVVVNGLDEARLQASAEELRRETGSPITPVVADVTTRDGQAKLLEALPDPDILVTNAGGPPFKDFRALDRDAILTGVTWNMVTPIELIQATIEPMIARSFGRIVNITSISVRMPVQGLDLSSGARAGLTAFVAGSRALGRACRGHDQQRAARLLRHRPLLGRHRRDRQGPGQAARPVRQRAGKPGARRAGSAIRRNWAMPAPSCAARAPATSPARTCCSTAACSTARSDIDRSRAPCSERVVLSAIGSA